MASIALSLPYVLQNEGGYTVDDGGPTNFGITIPDMAAFLHEPESSISANDIKNMSVATAQAIYLDQYWAPMNLSLINSQAIATCIFDTGVNRGIYIGQLYAQKVCLMYGHPLQLDGVIGPISLQAINGLHDPIFIRSYEQLEWAGYQAILANNPAFEIYRAGWENRAKRLLTLI